MVLLYIGITLVCTAISIICFAIVFGPEEPFGRELAENAKPRLFFVAVAFLGIVCAIMNQLFVPIYVTLVVYALIGLWAAPSGMMVLWWIMYKIDERQSYIGFETNDKTDNKQ